MSRILPNPPYNHAINCRLGDVKPNRKLSVYDSCMCHWQAGYDCPRCQENIVNMSDHMVQGRAVCEKFEND